MADPSDGAFAAADIRLKLRTRAGRFWFPWRGEMPKLGAVIEIAVDNARVV